MKSKFIKVIVLVKLLPSGIFLIMHNYIEYFLELNGLG